MGTYAAYPSWDDLPAHGNPLERGSINKQGQC